MDFLSLCDKVSLVFLSDPFKKASGAHSSTAKINNSRWMLLTESQKCKMWGCLFKGCQNLRRRALIPVSYMTITQLFFPTFLSLLSSASCPAALANPRQIETYLRPHTRRGSCCTQCRGPAAPTGDSWEHKFSCQLLDHEAHGDDGCKELLEEIY